MSIVMPTVLRCGCLCGASTVTRQEMMPSEKRSRRATRSRTLVSIASDGALLWKRIWDGTCITDAPRPGQRSAPQEPSEDGTAARYFFTDRAQVAPITSQLLEIGQYAGGKARLRRSAPASRRQRTGLSLPRTPALLAIGPVGPSSSGSV